MPDTLPTIIRTPEEMSLPWPDGTTARDDDGDLLTYREGRWRFGQAAMQGHTLPYTDVTLPVSDTNTMPDNATQCQHGYDNGVCGECYPATISATAGIAGLRGDTRSEPDALLTDHGVPVKTAEGVDEAFRTFATNFRLLPNTDQYTGARRAFYSGSNAAHALRDEREKIESASYPLPVWGPDATAEQIAESIPEHHWNAVAGRLIVMAERRDEDARAAEIAASRSASAREHIEEQLRESYPLSPHDKEKLIALIQMQGEHVEAVES